MAGKAGKGKAVQELALVIAEHQAALIRLAEAWGQRICDSLDSADRRTIAALKEILRDVEQNYTANTAQGMKLLKSVQKKIEAIRVGAYVEAEKALRSDSRELMDNEAKWARRLTAELTGEKASAFFALTPKAMKKILDNAVLINKPWNEWWTNVSASDIARVSEAVNAGIASGATVEQLVRKIMGTKANNYTDGVMSANRKQARNMARTICCGVANQAKDAFYQANSGTVKQVEWLSTLDGRTCPVCGGLDRMRWGLQVQHPVPPSHPSCRCVLLPVTELTDMGDDLPRTKANADFEAEAKRAYEKKYPAKRWEDLSASTRKRYYYKAMNDWEKRTGKPAYSTAPGRMRFTGYFKQMSDRQKLDYLGAKKFKLWKSGRFSVDDFVPPYPNRAMTVKELKAKDLEAFGRQ